jgi:hypothetical protein
MKKADAINARPHHPLKLIALTALESRAQDALSLGILLAGRGPLPHQLREAYKEVAQDLLDDLEARGLAVRDGAGWYWLATNKKPENGPKLGHPPKPADSEGEVPASAEGTGDQVTRARSASAHAIKDETIVIPIPVKPKRQASKKVAAKKRGARAK